ncbi:MAG: pyrroline-5-carboxylate reductase [Pirellulales bacterium]|nr:pyrroline-5-carboxylate reductase [Pirellulales bacterium]
MEMQRVGFIGAGQMATALAKGLIQVGAAEPATLVAADPSDEARQQFAQATGTATTAENLDVLGRCDVLVLAIKPQQLAGVLAQLCGRIPPEMLVVSIVAGVRLATLTEGLGWEIRIARVMPNTPCLVGQGASAFCLGTEATPEDAQRVRRLLESAGLAVEVDEALLDAVTGLSGSGPAFVYLMIEALSDGGVRMGLPRSVATTLAAQTVRGAAEMVLTTGEHPSVLRDRVTSPGGTTIAGLKTLEAGGVRAALMAAVEAATVRSIELGNG